MTPAGHVRNRLGGDDETTMDALEQNQKQSVNFSQSKKISEEPNSELMTMMASLRREDEGNVKNLEAKSAAGFRNEGIQRKKDSDGLEAKMMVAFKNEENERNKFTKS